MSICHPFGSTGTTWAQRLEESVPSEVTSAAVKSAIGAAFSKTHDGWSSDEVLLQDELNQRFVAACQKVRPELSAQQCNWGLLTLRKAGQLHANVTRRRTDQHDAYRHAAEIAARWVEDKHGLNTDRALCDPDIRAQFDRMAQSVAPSVEPYLLRKAAFGLRKARQLRPEYVARVADWGRKVTEWRMGELREQLEQLSAGPGVYLFRDKTGYLYIGEAENLARRLGQHVSTSDRDALAHYFTNQGVKADEIVVEIHEFAPDSNARLSAHRRAYESDLISRRKPRFNVRP